MPNISRWTAIDRALGFGSQPGNGARHREWLHEEERARKYVPVPVLCQPWSTHAAMDLADPEVFSSSPTISQ